MSITKTSTLSFLSLAPLSPLPNTSQHLAQSLHQCQCLFLSGCLEMRADSFPSRLMAHTTQSFWHWVFTWHDSAQSHIPVLLQKVLRSCWEHTNVQHCGWPANQTKWSHLFNTADMLTKNRLSGHLHCLPQMPLVTTVW